MLYGLRRLVGALALLAALALSSSVPGPLTPAAHAAPASAVPLDTQLTAIVTTGDTRIALTVYYRGASDEWAQSVVGQVQRGLPALVEATGFPYPGPGTMRIDHRSGEAIHGYAGTAGCRVTYCSIALSPTSDDLTLLHELAHLWTQPFAKRWLAEGYAEYASLKAAALLNIGSQPEFAGYGAGPPSVPLSEWGDPIDLFTASGDQLIAEYEGYDLSYRLFLILEDAVGAENLTAANVVLFSEQTPYTVGSRLYMDTLEDVSGANLDDLFLEWVLGPGTTDLVRQRREARDRLVALRAQAEPLGLTVDESIQDYIEEWRFEEALAVLDRKEANLAAYAEMAGALAELRPLIEEAGLPYPQPFAAAAETWDFGDIRDAVPLARDAVDAYVDAGRVVDAGRNPLQQVGLLLRDPEGKLQRASDNFAAGLFAQSTNDSHAARDMVQGATRAAFTRGLLALIVIAGAGVAAVFWLRREEPLAAGDETGP